MLLADGDVLGAGLFVTEGDALGIGDTVGTAVGLAVTVGVAVLLGVGLGVADICGDALGEGLIETIGVGPVVITGVGVTTEGVDDGTALAAAEAVAAGLSRSARSSLVWSLNSQAVVVNAMTDVSAKSLMPIFFPLWLLSYSTLDYASPRQA